MIWFFLVNVSIVMALFVGAAVAADREQRKQNQRLTPAQVREIEEWLERNTTEAILERGIQEQEPLNLSPGIAAGYEPGARWEFAERDYIAIAEYRRKALREVYGDVKRGGPAGPPRA